MKNIKFPKVENVSVAVLFENDEWNTYLINSKNEPISTILVESYGYGTNKNNEPIKTSKLRRHIPELPAQSYAMLEALPKELHSLNNQYWVSFYIGSTIYDKKFVFVPDSIVEENLTTLPLINKKRILIK